MAGEHRNDGAQLTAQMANRNRIASLASERARARSSTHCTLNGVTSSHPE